MSRKIVWTTQFKKDYKLAEKRGLDIALLDDCIRILAAGEELSTKFRATIILPADGAVIASAISNPTGF
jgi:mRNA-degrading endonuclease YafQ of YafQ-DinJ toxin-antitoxin module